MAKGEAGAKLAIARNLLGLGLSAEQVSSATELPVDEIRKLKSDCG
ncbi:MAG: hypothetical protein LBW77_03690 [Verrucomicrobiota bacterium]|nr:hypothetical protein [Verrucomicrobiota bacterium]